MDLIAGLPTDTEESFRRTVDTVLALAPENITIHTLSIKRGARLHFGEETLPSDGTVEAMLDYAAARLRESGYSPYYLYRQKNMSGGFENVGWTRPGFENLYNICIMEELCSIHIESIDRLCRDKEKITGFYRTYTAGTTPEEGEG